MVKYDTGIEFITTKKIDNCCLSIGKVNCQIIKPKKPLAVARKNDQYFRLILESPNLENAVECMELICSAKSVIDSVIEIDKDKLLDNIYIGERNRICGNSCVHPNFIEMSELGSGWYFAILIAEKASKDIHSKIAVLKYYNARIIYDIHPKDLDPINYSDNQYSSLLDKLRFAYSLIDINSIIEELGIEIRANSQKPSTIACNVV